MDQKEAMDFRCSRRNYLKAPIKENALKKLEEELIRIRASTGLHFELVINDNSAFENKRKTYGFFKNVYNYIVVIGQDDPVTIEKLGYYGEDLVLTATALGLGTCWVGGTFDKGACPCALASGEKIHAVIALGYVESKKGLMESLIAKVTHRKTKSIEAMSQVDGSSPIWFKEGMIAVQKAPSAFNKQPVIFFYKEGTVSARVVGEQQYEYLDLGIAKFHFKLGAGELLEHFQ